MKVLMHTDLQHSGSWTWLVASTDEDEMEIALEFYTENVCNQWLVYVSTDVGYIEFNCSSGNKVRYVFKQILSDTIAVVGTKVTSSNFSQLLHYAKSI